MTKIRILRYLIAIVFLLSGSAKLAGLDFEVVAFERWGYPSWFMYLTGAAETAGGVALLLNQLTKLAAPALALLMIGAISTHIRHQEWPMLMVALVIFGGCLVLSRNLWKQNTMA